MIFAGLSLKGVPGRRVHPLVCRKAPTLRWGAHHCHSLVSTSFDGLAGDPPQGLHGAPGAMPSEASHVETVTAIGRGPARYGSAGCAVVPRRPVARHRPRPGWRCRGEGGAPHQRGHPLIRQAADVEGTQRAGRPDWGGSKPYQGTTERSAWQTVLARPSDASPAAPPHRIPFLTGPAAIM